VAGSICRINLNLRAEMTDVEALARAAEAAVDALPAPVTERQRLVFGRIQSLVTKTSQQASASLRFANAQVTAFTAQLATDREPRSRVSDSLAAESKSVGSRRSA